MRRLLHNLSVRCKKAGLAIIQSVPDTVRQYLSRNRLLTRIYLFFDHAKYVPIYDRDSYEEFLKAEKYARQAIPHSAYEYAPPELNPEFAGELNSLDIQPLISIIMPVFNTDPEWLDKAVRSVTGQWYEHWELCIADDHSDRPGTRDYLEALEHPNIRIRFLTENGNIAAASNQALAMARGDYVALMDHDDELAPDALFEVVKAINKTGAEFIYSDEDKLDVNDHFMEPHFKPDFSPDMLLSQNYLSHLGVIKKSLVDQAGGFSPGTDGAQDYDLYLKVLELTNRVAHVPKVLYHWRKVPGSTAATFRDKSYAQEAGVRALSGAVRRRHLDAEVLNARFPGTYRVKYRIHDQPLISIIIPFKDRPELLSMCVGSILEKSTWSHFEIIGVSNNSEEPATFAEMVRIGGLDDRVCFHEHNAPFNFSGINNHAVKDLARGEHVLLLNNDIEIITSDWLEALLEFSQRNDVAAVGGKLYYPDDRLQHAGIIIGIGGVAGHSHKYFDRDDNGYFSRPHIVQNISAVTGACMMVKRCVYLELGGLNEDKLQIAFNDVDFCLRAREAGYLNVFTPHCEAYHHESVSRGYEDSRDKQNRFRSEIEYMEHRHERVLARGDPYYNPNLTLLHENFGLSPRLLLSD